MIEVAKLRELLAKATPGEWLVGRSVPSNGQVRIDSPEQCIAYVYQLNVCNNAVLIAAMHEAMPRLLAIAEAVEAAPESDLRVMETRDGFDEVVAYELDVTNPLVGKRVRLVACPVGGEEG